MAPGCRIISTGNTLEEVEKNIAEAIEFYLEGIRQDGDPIPAPSRTVLVKVA